MTTIDLRTLPKDCDCLSHNEPHWLYMDKLIFQRNLHILRRGGALSVRAFALEEAARLKEKHANLVNLGVQEGDTFLLPDGYKESDYNQLTRDLIESMKTG